VKVDEGAALGMPAESAVRQTIKRGEENQSLQLNLKEAWAGLHFVLTGELPIPRQEALKRRISWDDESLENAIMGGTETDYRASYGPARYLAPKQVENMSAQLSRITADEFKDRYDAEALTEENIPPGGWNAAAADWLSQNFTSLQRFYGEAAARRQGVLVYFI